MKGRYMLEEKPDQSEFRIPASDTKGHNARHWFRCIPMMARQVEQIIQSKKFPYRTKGDLLRHALHKHMGWLSSIESVPSVSGQVDAIIEIMRDEEMNNDFHLVFEKLGERITQHITAGAHREATRLIMIVQTHIAEMPDGFWKDKYSEQMGKKYSSIIKRNDKCNLGEVR